MVQSSPFNQGPNNQGVNPLPGSGVPLSPYQIPMSAMESPRDTVAFGLRAPKPEPGFWGKIGEAIKSIFGSSSSAADAAKNSSSVPLWAWILGGAAIIGTAGHFGGLWKKIGKIWREAGEKGGNAAGGAGAAAGHGAANAARPTDAILNSLRTRLAKNSDPAEALQALKDLPTQVHATHQVLYKELLTLASNHTKGDVVKAAAENAHRITNASERSTLLTGIVTNSDDAGVLHAVLDKVGGLEEANRHTLLTQIKDRTNDANVLETIAKKADSVADLGQQNTLLNAIVDKNKTPAVLTAVAEKAPALAEAERHTLLSKIIDNTTDASVETAVVNKADTLKDTDRPTLLTKIINKTTHDSVVEAAAKKADSITDLGQQNTLLNAIVDKNKTPAVLTAVAEKAPALAEAERHTLLSKIIDNTTDASVETAVVNKADTLKDTDRPTLLTKIVNKTTHDSVVEAAAKKADSITDLGQQNTLLNAIVDKNKTPAVLTAVAEKAPALAEAERHTLLSKIIDNTTDASVETAVVNKADTLKDTDRPTLLTKIVNKTTHDSVFEAAAKKADSITDLGQQNTLLNAIVDKNKTPAVLTAVAEKAPALAEAERHTLLSKIIDNTTDASVETAVVNKADTLKDTDRPTLLTKIINKTTHDSVFEAAAKKADSVADLGQQNTLLNAIVDKNKTSPVLTAVVEKAPALAEADRHSLLTKIFSNTTDAGVQTTVVNKIGTLKDTDRPTLLTHIVTNTTHDSVVEAAAKQANEIVDLTQRNTLLNAIVDKKATPTPAVLNATIDRVSALNEPDRYTLLNKILTKPSLNAGDIKTIVEKFDSSLLTNEDQLAEIITNAVKHPNADSSVYQAVGNNTELLKSLEIQHLQPLAEAFAKSKATPEEVRQLFQNVHNGDPVKLEALLERLAGSTAPESRKAAIENVELLQNATSRYLTLKKAVNPATNDELVEAALNQFGHVTDQKQLQDLLENVLPSVRKTNTLSTSLYGPRSGPYDQIDTFKLGFSKIGLIEDQGIRDNLFALNLRQAVVQGDEAAVTAIKDRMQALTPEQVGLSAGDTAILAEMKTKAMKSAKELAANLGLLDIVKKLPSETEAVASVSDAGSDSGEMLNTLETFAEQQKDKITPLHGKTRESNLQANLQKATDDARKEYINNIFAYIQAGWTPSEGWITRAVHPTNKAQTEAIRTLIELNQLKPGILGNHVHLIDHALITDEATRQSLILQGLRGPKADQAVGKIADFIPEGNREAFFQQVLTAGYPENITNAAIDQIDTAIANDDIKQALYKKAALHTDTAVAKHAKTKITAS